MLQNPQFADAYKGLDSKGQFAVGQMLLRAARSDNTESDERTANVNKLTGQSYVDPEGFKKVNLFEENLTQQQRSALFQQQTAMIKGKPLEDPALGAALKDPDVRSQLDAAGINSRDTPDDYKLFVGAMKNELLEARARGKEVTPEMYTDLASKLLQKQPGTGWFGTNTGAVARYTVPVGNIPPAFVAKGKEALASKYPDGNIPDSALEHWWALSLWNTVQGQKTNGR
jgi:hypothetical protein